MSALSRMAAKLSTSKTQPPVSPMAKTNGESESATADELDTSAVSEASSDSLAALSQGPGHGFLRRYGPFAQIPPFSRSGDIQEEQNSTFREGSEIPTELSNGFSNHETVFKNHLPTSQRPNCTSYKATITSKQFTVPKSGYVIKTLPRTKQEDILDYVYDWVVWAAEIPDLARRSEVLRFVMDTLERVLKSGIEKTGMALAPNDVNGVKRGTKRTLEGDVNIQVIITSSVKENSGEHVNELAVHVSRDNTVKDKKGHVAADARVPSESCPELLTSIEKASKTSLTKGKRAANEMDLSNEVSEVKRQRTVDADAASKLNAQTTDTADRQSQAQSGRQEKSSSESMSPMSTAEEEKRTRYRQQIFQSRLNHIFKGAGKVQTRGRCTNWETVLTRLKDAGVGVKWRNEMLRDFCSGHAAWNEDANIDPSEKLAHYAEFGFVEALGKASAGKARKVESEAEVHNASETTTFLSGLETLPALNIETPIPDAFVPAQPQSQLIRPIQKLAAALTTQKSKKLIVNIRTFKGFDPEDYSLYNQYQHENFMFTFKPTSTIKERVMLSDALIAQVDKKLNAAIDNNTDVDEPEELDSKRQFIRNGKGKVVATGNFVDLNSDYMLLKQLADGEDPWTFKGSILKVDPAYYPSAWTGRLKQAGEALGVRVDK